MNMNNLEVQQELKMRSVQLSDELQDERKKVAREIEAKKHRLNFNSMIA